MLLNYFSGSVANVISKKLCLSWRVCIIFHLNFKTFFLAIYAFSLLAPSNPSKKDFPQETSICFVILMPGLRIISPRPRHSEEICSIVSGRCSVFPRNLLKDLLNRAGEITSVLISDICNVYEIAAYDWLYLQYLGRVKIVDVASKYLGNIEDCRLILVC